MTSAIASLLESVFPNPSVAQKYANLLEEESIDSIDELQSLDLEDITSLGIGKLQAKRLLKNGKRILLKIAIDRPENVIGGVRVFLGAKLRDIRREIDADELDVPRSYVFLQEGAEVTSAQEAKWTASMFFDGGSETLQACVVTESWSRGKDEFVIEKHAGLLSAKTNLLKGVQSTHSTAFNSTDNSPFTTPLPPPSSFLPKTEEEEIGEEETEEEIDWYSGPMKAIPTFTPIPPTLPKPIQVQKPEQDKAVPLKKPDPPADIASKTDVYIGNLNPRTGTTRIGDDRLKHHVYQFGKVKRIQRLADDNWAYVIFSYPLSARVCINETHGLRMGEHELVCTFATDRSRAEPEEELRGCVRLRGVPRAASPKQLMDAFVRSPFVSNVAQLKSKGEAFVMFRERVYAERVAKQYRDGVVIRGQTVSVEMFDEFESYEAEAEAEAEDESSQSDGGSESKEGSGSVRCQFTDAVRECLRSNAPTYDRKVVPLVTTESRLAALCLVLFEQSVSEPSLVARLCGDISGADDFPQLKNYHYGDFKRVLMSEIEKQLVFVLDLLTNTPDSEKGIRDLTGLSRFLGHLHKNKVVSPMILLGCASKIARLAVPACRNAIGEILKLTGDDLGRQSHLQTKLNALRKFSAVKENPTDEDTETGAEDTGAEDTGASDDEAYEVGEKIFNTIVKYYPGSAGKITGMLLDMGPDLARSLLDNREELYRQAERANMMLEGQGYY